MFEHEHVPLLRRQPLECPLQRPPVVRPLHRPVGAFRPGDGLISGPEGPCLAIAPAALGEAAIAENQKEPSGELLRLAAPCQLVVRPHQSVLNRVLGGVWPGSEVATSHAPVYVRFIFYAPSAHSVTIAG